MMTEFKKLATTSGSRWQSLLRWLMALCSGAVLLCLIGLLVLLAFLWVIHHRNLPDWVIHVAGLVLLVVAGLLFWQTMRCLARCQYRFRLRTLLLVMVILGTVLGMLGNRLRFAARQNQAIRALWQENSHADYWLSGHDDSKWFCWLIQWLGFDPFAEITDLNLRADGAVAVFTQHPTEFAGVRLIDFDNISDQGLEHLASSTLLRNLEAIGLHGGTFTDAGLKHLAGAENLTLLMLNGCSQITGVGLAHLEQLPALEKLHLLDEQGKMNLTDAALAHLGNMPRLRWLNLKSGFSDAGLMHLRRLDNLELLAIQSNALTDDGLRHIAHLNITSLSLYAASGVTDDSVKHLRSLRKLQRLHVSGSKLTPAGIAELRGALPDCEIVVN
jgi:hypothetical protein